MKWLKWTCERCGQENHLSRPALPRETKIDAVCPGCRVKSLGVAWSAASAPERTVHAEANGWACPFCKAHNDVPAGSVGLARMKCSICDETCNVIFPGSLDLPGDPAGAAADEN